MEVIKNWYKDWFNSPYYPILYSHHDEREAADFISKLIQYLHPPLTAFVLDAACGKGRYAKELADKGFEVTGIDLSLENIHAARQLENKKLTFYQHDMRYPFRINYFDIVLNLFTSFGYFDTPRENENALRTFVTALKPGGILVLDYLNSNFVKQHLVADEVKIIQGVEFSIHREMDKQQNAFLKNIRINDELNLKSTSFTERVAAYTRTDFKNMFEKSGLEIVEVFGDYYFNEFDENISPRIILIARKHI